MKVGGQGREGSSRARVGGWPRTGGPASAGVHRLGSASGRGGSLPGAAGRGS